MTKRRKAIATNAKRSAAQNKTAAAKRYPVHGWKLWRFRVLALVGAPAALWGLLELILRLTGYGYPTTFALPASHNGQKIFVQNNQFGWRFFGPRRSRLPFPFSLSPSPTEGTIRIFVFGESAAKGDPDPHFGLARMLEATLSLRHPSVRFEVVNAAMTAINSHTILPIVRDCAGIKSDAWVIYMGNNEVVGPFGSGTVFGPQTPPLPLIRSTLALKTTRTGQLLDSVLAWVQKRPSDKSEWGGMEMFLDQQIRADDPRMNSVYHHFERNLADILQAGLRSGAGIVVSTVAVNLKDCAPFASAHRAGLSEADRVRWDELYQLGIQAQAAGNYPDAGQNFREAAQLDDTFAVLRFRQGQCALALGKGSEARPHFQAARDLDTLRFRCDTRLNEAMRKEVANRESERIVLADAERVFAEQSLDRLPGEKLFYEHVHLTFEGNHLLARTIGEQVEKLLADRLAPHGITTQSWPSPADCARRLGWSDWSQVVGLKGVLPRLNNPPFTGQFNHQSQMQRVQAALEKLSATAQPPGISNAIRICEAALAAVPGDAALNAQLAAIRKAAGDLSGAAAAARRELELLPSDAEGWFQLGSILARQRQYSEATAAFQRAVQLDSQDVVFRENLAQSMAALGRHEEALREFRHVLAVKPHLGLAWLHLGQVLEQMGRKTEAEDCYQQALTNPGQHLAGLVELAGFCQGRGWFEAAATNYIQAIKSDPSNAQLHVGAGQNLAALGQNAEAARHSAEAVSLSPAFAEAHLLHGMVLGRQGLVSEAMEEFREALKLKPDLLDARINLGIAIAEQNPVEALAHFEAVLRQSPANATALKQARLLRAKLANQPSR